MSPPVCSSFVFPTLRATLRGFSLVELLTVTAVMAVLAGMAAPAMRSLVGAGGLTAAGYKADGFFSGARQNSISRGALTAVIVLKSTPDEGAYRTMVALERRQKADGSPSSSADWVQVSKFEQLPTGVVFQNTLDNSNFLTAGQTMTADLMLPTVTYKGKSYAPDADYSYQVFLPSGRLKSPPSPCNLQLASGYYEGNEFKHTGPSDGNYFNLFFVDATGETKITRP